MYLKKKYTQSSSLFDHYHNNNIRVFLNRLLRFTSRRGAAIFLFLELWTFFVMVLSCQGMITSEKNITIVSSFRTQGHFIVLEIKSKEAVAIILSLYFLQKIVSFLYKLKKSYGTFGFNSYVIIYFIIINNNKVKWL